MSANGFGHLAACGWLLVAGVGVVDVLPLIIGSDPAFVRTAMRGFDAMRGRGRRTMMPIRSRRTRTMSTATPSWTKKTCGEEDDKE